MCLSNFLGGRIQTIIFHTLFFPTNTFVYVILKRKLEKQVVQGVKLQQEDKHGDLRIIARMISNIGFRNVVLAILQLI